MEQPIQASPEATLAHCNLIAPSQNSFLHLIVICSFKGGSSTRRPSTMRGRQLPSHLSPGPGAPSMGCVGNWVPAEPYITQDPNMFIPGGGMSRSPTSPPSFPSRPTGLPLLLLLLLRVLPQRAYLAFNRLICFV